MRISKIAAAGLTGVGLIALLTGCGSAPTATSAAPSVSAVAGFKPCIVSDLGGFDDRSFNQQGWQGVQQASQTLGVTPIKVQSKAETDYAPNLVSLVSQGCTTIVTVGFNLAAATAVAAKANPKINYLLIDATPTDASGNSVTLPNVKTLLFDTAQAAFLAGYLAAGYTTTKIVGTYGGLNLPTVSIFMDGFKQGIDYYNKQNSASVKLLGWNGTDGSFTGGFAADDKARNIAQGLIDQNADVILPVGGPIYQPAAAAIKASGKNIALMGVDADVTQTDPSVATILITSIQKEIQVAVNQTILDAGQGKFQATAYVGTLANNGVGLAPYHSYDSKVSQALQKKITDLKAQIIAGTVPIKSYLSQK